MLFAPTAKYTFWWPVKIISPDPEQAGKVKTEEFKMLFEALPQDEGTALDEELANLKTDRERAYHERSRIKRVCLDWQEVVDEKNNPIPFSAEMLELFIQFPWNRIGIYRGYYQAMSGEEARVKN